MVKVWKLALVAAVGLATITTTAVHAQNALQLDIVGGTWVNDTTYAGSETFQLAAILNPGNGSAPESDDTFYVCVSLAPPTTSAASLGSFVFAGTTVNVTADMINSPSTPPGLPGHGQFPNFYKEFSFAFDLSNAGKCTLYDVQAAANPHVGPVANTSGTAFFKLFDVDTTGLASGVEIHFDLYNKDDNEVNVDKNAPFSHDAQSIPEPTGFVLTGLGLALFGMLRRHRAA